MTLETSLLPPGDDYFSIPDFRSMLATETKRMTELCDDWKEKLEKNREIISDVTEGEIRCVVGQGRLIMAERFSQFSGLVDNCEFQQGEKETTCMDLRGFWEMIYFQVEDVDKKFAKLEKVEKNGWVDEVTEQEEVAPNKVLDKGLSRKRGAVVAKKVASAGSAGLKALIAAKRRKVAELVENDGWEDAAKEVNTVNIVIYKASDDSTSLTSPEKIFDGGFFSVKSPARQVPRSPRASQSTGCDMTRKSVLTESAKRVSGLVSPFVSQVARRAMDNERHSPVKDSRRSSLFDDDLDQENDLVDTVRKVDTVSAAAM